MSMDEKVLKRLQYYQKTMHDDLHRTVKFWCDHSHDTEHGGFYNGLLKNGDLYDTQKYGWLQARQVWMYAKLYNSYEDFKTDEILDAAKKGADFLLSWIKEGHTWKCYFQVTKDGRPVKIQRTIFGECFYSMAMSELGKATGDDFYKKEAVEMAKRIFHWLEEDTLPHKRPPLYGSPDNYSTLAIPMASLWIIDQINSMGDFDHDFQEKFKAIENECIETTLQHSRRNGEFVLENIKWDGPKSVELPGSMGRLMNPGHAIECGWFLLKKARERNDEELKNIAIKNFILKPMEYGWDKEFGGLFSFMDVDGYPPIQLEWNMKLWWPHNEALISLLMAYQETKDQDILDKFDMVFRYSYNRFVDHVHGEWFGYLNQQGQVNSDFKSGPFKGCFHVPRCLMMCEIILKELLCEAE